MASLKRARIFISYKRVEPDTSVAREVFEALSQQHDVFIDQMKVFQSRRSHIR
jgi:hypothetical protein